MTMTVIPEATLRVGRLAKRFFGVTAVRDLSLELHGGAVHGLYGPPGSGKTTLVRLLTGEILPDEGSFTLRGRVLAAGGGALLPGRTVAANLYLGREPRTGGVIDRGRMAEDAAALLAALGMSGLEPDIRVSALDAAERLLLECACALTWNVALFVIDDAREVPDAALRLLADRGVTVLQLSDDLVGLLEHCDTVTVL